MKRLRICAALLLGGLVGCVVFSATPRATASGSSCRVTNLRTNVTYSSFDPAAGSAESGDTLTIRDRCEFVSSLEDPGFVLTLKGVGVGATLSGATNCDLPLINDGTLTIANLKIVACTAFGGQGVYNQGTLILKANTVITGGQFGGVVNATPDSRLIMNANSAISGNAEGGVRNAGAVVMTDHSRITHNTGNGIITPCAALTMNGHSAVTDNSPANIVCT